MSKFHFLIFLPFLYLQHHVVAIGFEFAAVQHSPHEIQLPHCHEDEVAALLEFRSSLDISQFCMKFHFGYRKLEQWNIKGNCCTWDGIECDIRDGHIIGLDLSATCLSGSFNSTSSVFRLLHVQKLNLASINFHYSQIPSTIGNFSRLTNLNLSDCWFAGPIPSQLLSLTNLTSLDLSQNYDLEVPNLENLTRSLTKLEELHLYGVNISSRIPHVVTNLTSLKVLDISDCRLTGELPSSIFNLPKLQVLNLSGNPGLSGYLPEFQPGSLLERIFLDGVSIFGGLPNSLGNLVSLTELSVHSSKLGGFIPSSIVNLTKLTSLSLPASKINGTLPSSFGYLTQLAYLDLSQNQLTGQIPYFFRNLINLEVLDLHSNQLTGEVPSQISKLTNLTWLDLSNNHLSGEIAPLICIPSYFIFLDLSNNNFTGVLPQCITNLTSHLENLSLHGNNFVGKIPEMEGMWQGLKMIDLSNNQLVGPLPRSLSSCLSLEFLNLGNNMLSDSFPSWLGSLDALTVLILRSNKLHGVIQDVEVGVEFPRLQILDLSHNFFEGHLPSKLFQFWNSTRTPHGYLGTNELYTTQYYLDPASKSYFYYYTMTLMNKDNKLEYPKIFAHFKVIDLSSNDFNGPIPTSMADVKGLQLLNLSNNHLVGTIPPYLGSLTKLQALDLSKNSLSGGIPQQLVQLTFLEYFSVSDNNLTGSIPQGNQFNTFGADSYEGNEGLCGDPLSRDCGNNLEPPPPPPGDDELDSEMPVYIEWKAVVVGFLSAFIVTALIGHHKIKVRQNWFVIISRLRDQRRRRVGQR